MRFNTYTEVIRAKKQHSCIWCLKPILIGERHWKYVGIHHGDFQNWRTHTDCREGLDESALDDIDGYICEEGHARGTMCEHGSLPVKSV